MIICDSQVHAPDAPRTGRAAGIDQADLLREMDGAGVDRCVIVPLEAPGDQSANNEAATEIARARPDRFALMGRFDVTKPENVKQIAGWKQRPHMLGMRFTFLRDPNRSLLTGDELDWMWAAAEAAGIPVMVLAPDLIEKIDQVAARYPRLRLVLDHLNLMPYQIYDDLLPAIAQLLKLSRYANVAVKASCLPSSVADPFPFRPLHEPIRRVIQSFGPRRVFWGSDLTRLTCTYSECVRLFTEELPYLTPEDKEWVMGRGVMEWIGWNTPLR